MLGLKFSRLVHASLAGGSLMLAGCVDRAYDFGDSGSLSPDPDDPDPSGDPSPSGNPDPNPTSDPQPPPPPDVPGPPQLIDAQFVDNQTLALVFSEAVAPPTAVDPAQFRLTAAHAPQGKYYYAYGTYYQEPGIWNGAEYVCEEYCYEYCYEECYEECFENCYWPPGPPVRVVGLSALPDRHDVLLLTLDNGIGPGLCKHLSDNFPEEWVSDLFITYTTQGSAPVTDNAGDILAPIAEHWAVQPGSEFEYIEGHFEFMQPMLPIPCVF